MKELNKKRNFSRRVFLRTAAAVGTALAVSPELNKVHAVTRVAACDEAMPTGKAKAATVAAIPVTGERYNAEQQKQVGF